jgi:acyl-coenzyme A synthetase/AMP-(fatty) acid ligase
VLRTHPNVADVAVVGVPGAGPHNQVIAIVVPRGEQQLEALAQHCRAHLKPEKFPDQLFWMPALPRTANGKVDRGALAASIQKRLQQPASQAV